MCAATILTNRVLVSAAHCFNERYRDSDWFVRVGDNFMASRDPSEQTFQVIVVFNVCHWLRTGPPDGWLEQECNFPSWFVLTVVSL